MAKRRLGHLTPGRVAGANDQYPPLVHRNSIMMSSPATLRFNSFLLHGGQASTAQEQPRLLWEYNGPVDDSGHGHWISNHRRVLLTEPDRTMMAKTDGFLSGARLGTFVAEHSCFLSSSIA
jgi:hypothetical protein